MLTRLLLLLLFAAPLGAATLSDQLESANSLIQEAKYLQAIKAAQEISQQAEKAKDYKTLGRANLIMADAHYYLGHLDQYRSLSEKALGAYTKSGDTAGIGRSYYFLAFCYELSQPEEMIKLLEKAKTYAGKSSDLKLQMHIENAYATALFHLSKFRLGNDHLEVAGKLAESLQDQRALATVYQNIALNDANLASYQESLVYFQKARAIYEKIDEKRGYADLLGNFGEVNLTLGDVEQALSCHEEALKMYEFLGIKRGQLLQFANLAAVYEFLGEQATATDFRRKAFHLAEETQDERMMVHLTLLIARGMIQEGKLDQAQAQLDGAREHLQKMQFPSLRLESEFDYAELEGKRKNFSSAMVLLDAAEAHASEMGDLPDVSFSYSVRGKFLEAMGEPERAISAYRQAIGISEQISSPLSLHLWYAKLAELYVAIHKDKEAVASYEKSLDYINRLDRFVVMDRFRINLFREVTNIFRSYAMWLVSVGKTREGWIALERGRARELMLRLEQAQGSLETNPAEQEILSRISSLQRHLRQDEMTKEQRGTLLGQIADGEQEYESVRRAVLRKKPHSDRGLSEVTISDTGSLLIEYAFHRDELLIFSQKAGRIAFRKLPHAQALLDRVRLFIDKVSDPKRDFRDDLAAKLYEDLLGPELNGQASGRVILVPDDLLHFLPFSALKTHEKKSLSEKFVVSIAPSVSILNHLERQKKEGSNSLLVLANTKFPNSRNYGAPLPPLASAGKEAEIIGRYAQGSEVLIDQTEGQIKRANLSSFRVIHFATHSLIDEVRPERSCVVVNADKSEDGFLQARELCRMSLPADMVVLSGCRTGKGRLVAGEGLIGLSHAFITAGAKSLVLSLWDVSDEGTAEFMSRFYDHLSGGTIAEALRQTQTDMIRSRKWNHPCYWSAFVVTGYADQTVHFRKNRRLPWIMSVVVSSVVLLLILLWRKKARVRTPTPL